jgi:hypothetical protein
MTFPVSVAWQVFLALQALHELDLVVFTRAMVLWI